MSEWQPTTLTQLGSVGRGRSRHRPRDDASLYGGAYPFIQTGDVKHSPFYITSYSQTYSELGLAQSKLWDCGTLCITIAANIADTAILKLPACFPDSIIGFISDPQKSDVRFVKYCMDTLKVHFESISRGTTQDNLSVEKLLSIKFKVPPVAEQKKIAAVLSAYDELIENNRRRIALLEKLAEEIYREWFVRIRFPGHEKVKLVKGVPEGWTVRPFPEVVDINPTERIDKEDERPFVAMEQLSLTSLYFTHNESRKGHVGPKFRNWDVLFPRITPSVENGKRGLVLTLADGEVAQGSTEFIVFREKVLTAEHIYFLSVSDGFRTNAELSMTGASGRQRVQEQCFNQFLVKTPPPSLRERFTSVVRPMVTQIHNLSKQTEALRQTRDLLLPRLISGKLSVEDLDIQFPPGMAKDRD